MGEVLSGVTGFAAGFIVAGGIVAMVAGPGIMTRFVGISHTAVHIKAYEDAIWLGALAGNILTTFDISLPVGTWILALGGAFIGIFVGGWILALAEILNVFPVYCRRIGITKGLSWIVVSIAIGKTAGSLVHFYMRWGGS